MITQAPASSQIDFSVLLHGKVYDRGTLKAEARRLGIEPTTPNLQRVRRAFDLLENGNIELIGIEGEARIYEAYSQSRPNHIHLVVSTHEARCTCEDARHARRTGCKHSLAVRIKERKEREAQALENAEAREAWVA